ncbi:tetratricopeptide repeat protein [Streptomyces sp. NPDC059866]|uniref:tetratricopeptide repeat protein n=1 Tax=Streptomyces sp. NPDC059866 TaxID=3346978 RepID=UPI00364DB8FF
MDAAELDRRARTHEGWTPPWLVSLLVEHGHLDVVRERAGFDWYCARALAGEVPLEDALVLLRPYADSGWWAAADAVSELLEACGRTDEAVALVRPHAEGGERLAVRRLAELLARQGRTGEVIALLGPGIEDWYLADALVELTEGCGRDDEVLALMPDPGRECRGRCHDDAGDAGRRAKLLERMGRVDEAVELLHGFVLRDNVRYVNVAEQLADLLARRGREAELREFVAGDGTDHAAYRLAEWLSERGLVDEAADVLRPFADGGSPNARWKLADLLKRNGRVDEAIEALRPEPGTGADDWIVRELWTLMADHGRADEAVAVLDEIIAGSGDEEELLLQRIWLLDHCGRTEQAIAELRALHEAGADYLAHHLAHLLTDAGRLDEALTLLRPHTRHPHSAAELMIRQGRVKEAVTLLEQYVPAPLADDPWSTEPPF